MITPLKASHISKMESEKENAKFAKLIVSPVPKGMLTVAIPNYNNEGVLCDVMCSHLGHFQAMNIEILIYDNCSSDKSWEIISSFCRQSANIMAVRLPRNTGPHVSANIVLRSARTKYTLFSSGNDVIANNLLLARMYAYLEANEGIDLVYGRNIRNSTFSEPAEHTFSVPGRSRRVILGLSDQDCMDIATSLYTSSEPLWGLYRTAMIKEIPIVNSYGNDHFIISALALRGGITGIMQPFREVSDEVRTLQDLRESQVQLTYALPKEIALLPPINHTNFMALAHTYYQGIKALSITLPCETIYRTLKIIVFRFSTLIFTELRAYKELHDRLSVSYERMPAWLRIDIEAQHEFVACIFLPLVKDELLFREKAQ